jgi:plasmid replication initiation protein
MADIKDDFILKQHHEMIVMKPSVGNKVTLIGRRLYSALLATSQLELNGTTPLATHTFEAPLMSLLKVSGGEGEERTVAKRYFQEMQDLKVSWESTSPGDGVKWVGLHMLSQAKIFVRTGQTWVSWAFPPEIMGMIINPDRYAVWNLRITAKLGTYSALALYEICARYRDNPSGVTSRKPLDWWIDALSNTSASADKKRREWRKFKVEKVNEAIADINKETDIEIELIEHKSGRMVTEIQFGVRKKQSQPVLNQQHEINAEIIIKAERLGIAESRADSLIRMYGEELFVQKLDETRARMFDKSKKSIDSPYAYLKVLLKNSKLGYEATPAKSFEKFQDVDVKREVQTMEQKTQLDLDNLSVETKNVRSIMQEINELPESQRKDWINKAVTDLKANGMFNAIIQKRAQESKISNGILGGKVVSIYAEEIYGPMWRTQQEILKAEEN